MCYRFQRTNPTQSASVCLGPPSHSHLRTRNELPQPQTLPYLQAPLAVLRERGGDGIFCAELRYAGVSRIDPRLQSGERPGAADIELFRSTPPAPDPRTNSITGVMLKQRLQTPKSCSLLPDKCTTECVKTRYHTFNNLKL